jgi:hypothetical protein
MVVRYTVLSARTTRHVYLERATRVKSIFTPILQADKLLFDAMFASIKKGHSDRFGDYNTEILISFLT